MSQGRVAIPKTQQNEEIEKTIVNDQHDGPSQLDGEKSQTPPAERQRTIHGVKWSFVVLAILFNLLFYAIDNTIVAVIQPLPNERNGHGFDDGQLYGSFDAKVLYILNSLLFLIGSAISGAAPELSVVIVGRIIGGIGGTGMYLGALTLISINTSPKETSQYKGYLALVWGFGSVIGPLIGGAFANSSATWRWGFYINVIIIGVSIPVYLLLVPFYSPRKEESILGRLRQLDWLGGILSMGAFASLILTISFGGTLYAWDSGSIIASIVVCASLFILLLLQQYFAVATSQALRILPLNLLGSKDMALCFICQVMVALIVPIPLYYIPLFFELAKGDSALRAGVKTLPLICFWVVTSALRGHLMPRTRWYHSWYISGSVLNIIAGVLLSQITVHTSTAMIFGLQILSGIGTGCYGQAGFTVAQRLVPSSDVHRAISLMLIAQLSGTTIGLAVGGTIIQNIALPRVRLIVPDLSAAQISTVIAGVASAVDVGLSRSQHDQVLNTIADASADTYILIYTAAAVSLACSFFFTPKKLW